MNKLVLDKVREAKKVRGDKTVPLREAVQAVFSRPNEDGMIEKVIGPLRSELDQLQSWDKSLDKLTVEAINALKNPKAFQPVVQVTYQIFLENLLLEMKPSIQAKGFERELAEKIKNAKIELTKEAQAERQLRLMKSAQSPSAIAEQILSPAEKK